MIASRASFRCRHRSIAIEGAYFDFSKGQITMLESLWVNTRRQEHNTDDTALETVFYCTCLLAESFDGVRAEEPPCRMHDHHDILLLANYDLD